jgi:AAA domain (dynein-related subfamily)
LKYNTITYNGYAYTRESVAHWTREQMRPFAKEVALVRRDGVNRTMLWNAAAEVQRDYVFEGKHPVVSGASTELENEFAKSLAKGATGEAMEASRNGEDELLSIIARRLQGKLSGAIDSEALEARLAALKAEILAGREQVVRVELSQAGEDSPRDLGLQHKKFPLLLKTLGIKARGKRHNVALVGPAGTGKTESAHQAALALGLKFYPVSVGPQTTQSQLVGYMDAHGNYVRTAVREAFEHGGVLLLDEFDSANAGVATCLNQLTANRGAGFSDGQYVERHPDFVVIAAMNTFGQGADAQYVGRNQMDAATLNRFAVIYWDQDNALESALCIDKDWCRWVQRVRLAVEELGLRHVVSPRASYDGAEALASGISRAEVELMYVWQGLKATEKAKVLAKLA